MDKDRDTGNVKLIVFLITASLFMIALMNAAAATCFWIKNSGYVMVIMFRFKDFAKYPFEHLQGIFSVIFTFIIPIAFIAYYPSLVILRPGQRPAAVMDLAVLRPTVLLPELQVLDAGRSQIRLHGFLKGCNTRRGIENETNW